MCFITIVKTELMNTPKALGSVLTAFQSIPFLPLLLLLGPPLELLSLSLVLLSCGPKIVFPCSHELTKAFSSQPNLHSSPKQAILSLASRLCTATFAPLPRKPVSFPAFLISGFAWLKLTHLRELGYTSDFL